MKLLRYIPRLIIFTLLSLLFLEFSFRLFLAISPHYKVGRNGINFYVNHKEYGVSHNKDVKVKVKYMEHPNNIFFLKTNKQGFREDRNTSLMKERDEFRILVLGDSHTDGVCNNSESFPNRFEHHLNSVASGRCFNVINAGVGGWSILEEYLFLKREGIRYNPDMVVVASYNGNDLADMLPRKVYAPQVVEKQNSYEIISPKQRAYPFLVDHSVLYSFFYWNYLKKSVITEKLLIQEIFQIEIIKNKRDSSVFDKYSFCVKKIRDLCEMNNIELVFLIIPTKIQVEGINREVAQLLERDAALAENDMKLTFHIAAKVMEILNHNEIKYIDPTAYLMRNYFDNGNKLYYDLDYHLNPKGCNLLGEYLFGNLKNMVFPNPKYSEEDQ